MVGKGGGEGNKERFPCQRLRMAEKRTTRQPDSAAMTSDGKHTTCQPGKRKAIALSGTQLYQHVGGVVFCTAEWKWCW